MSASAAVGRNVESERGQVGLGPPSSRGCGTREGFKVEGWVRKSFLEAGAEPQGNENASEEAGQISHQFAESDDEDGGEGHCRRD